MFRVTLQALLCAFLVVNAALADRDIVLLSGNASKVSISDEYGTIHITDGDPNTFVFECFDDVTHEPANIEFIGLSGTPSGTITVSILPGPGHTYGAASVYEVNLTDSNVTGEIEDITVSADLGTTGDVVCDNITGALDIGRDVTAAIEVGSIASDSTVHIHGSITASGTIEISDVLESTITVDGDVLDGDGNHIYIKRMADGHFECNNLEIRNEYTDWMVLGHEVPLSQLYTVEQTGTIKINGTLSGVIHSRSRCGVHFDVNELNGAEESFERITYGGIFSLTGFTDNSNIDIGTFTRGLINVRGGPLSETYSPQFLGTVDVGTEESPADMGIDDPDNVARIIAWDIFNDEPNAVPIPIGAAIHVWGNIYASLGATSVGDEALVPRPAVYATGDINGTLQIDGSLYGSVETDDDLDGSLQIGGSLSGSIDVEDDLDGEILVAGSQYGTIGLGDDLVGAIDIGDDLDGQIDIGGDLRKPGRIAVGDDVGVLTTRGHGVLPHGHRERARQIGCAGSERISNGNQVFTRCRGVRRGL